MHKPSLLALLCLMLSANSYGMDASKHIETWPLTVLDDAGRKLHFAEQAQTVVSLAPHITELLFAAGAGSNIVATSRFSDHPIEAQKIPMIGDAYSVNMEALLALNPDLVILWQSGVGIRTVELLERLGIRYFMSEPKTVTAMLDTLRLFGRLAGDPLQANEQADQLQARWQILQKNYRSKAPIKVFYQIWHQPLFTLSNPHIIDDILTNCGAENIFSDQPKVVFRTQLEAVLLANPEAILFGGLHQPVESETNRKFWRRFSQLLAVKNDHLIPVPEKWIHRPSPRMLDGAEHVCKELHQVRIARSIQN